MFIALIPLFFLFTTIDCTVHIHCIYIYIFKCSFSLWNFCGMIFRAVCTRCVFNIYFLLSPLISSYFHFSSFSYCIRCIFLLTFICSPFSLSLFSLSPVHSLSFAFNRKLQILVALFFAIEPLIVWPCTYQIYDKITLAHTTSTIHRYSPL